MMKQISDHHLLDVLEKDVPDALLKYDSNVIPFFNNFAVTPTQLSLDVMMYIIDGTIKDEHNGSFVKSEAVKDVSDEVTFDMMVVDEVLASTSRLYNSGIELKNTRINLRKHIEIDLAKFPADCQQLSFTLRHQVSQTRTIGVAAVQLSQDFINDDEWATISLIAEKRSDGAKFTLTIERKPHYYMMNIFMMTFLITLMSMTAFVLPVESLSEKQSLIVTLLLTSVAFKLVIGNELPKLPYNTSMDWYVLFCFTLQSAMLIASTITYVVDRQDWWDGDLIDIITGGFIASLHLIYSAWWFFRHQVFRQDTKAISLGSKFVIYDMDREGAPASLLHR